MDDKERLIKIETEMDLIKENINTLNKKTEEINSINTVLAVMTSSITDMKNDFKESIDDFKSSVNSLNTEFKASIDSLNVKVDNASNEPAKEKADMWVTIIKTVVSGIIMLGMGYIGVRLGLK